MKKITLDQGSDQWHHMRKGKITGTVLKSIMGTPKAYKDAMYDLIAERLTLGIDTEYENPMERGTRLEPEAIAMFELETGKSVDRVGFCQKDDNDSIANSPDGIVADTGDTEAVEIKCLGGGKHVKMWLENKIPDEYYWQCVQYFVVNDNLQKLYFVGYHPDITVHKINIIEINRNELLTDMNKAVVKQGIFLQEVEARLATIIKL